MFLWWYLILSRTLVAMAIKRKNFKKSSFRKPKELELKLFGMKHYLVSVYQVCSNNAVGLKLDPHRGVIDFPYLYVVKA
jgi:hypothetical protein